jgi:hypothetical protein
LLANTVDFAQWGAFSVGDFSCGREGPRDQITGAYTWAQCSGKKAGLTNRREGIPKLFSSFFKMKVANYYVYFGAKHGKEQTNL